VEDADVERRSICELLALIVPGSRRSAALDGDALIERGGGLAALASADAFEIAAHLEGRDDGGRASKVTLRAAKAIAAAFELGRRAAIARTKIPLRLASPEDVAAWARPRISALAHEELWVLAVDGRGHLRAARCVARGGLHGASVRGADPVRAALRLDASAFVLVHNHPSGDPTPSKEDVVLTAQVAAAGAAAHVPLLDHVVVARGGAFECVPFSSSPPQQVRSTTE
jgi:DNA repair protein RadC